MSSNVTEKLKQHYNRLPAIDPELIEVARINSDFDIMMNVDLKSVAYGETVAEYYRKIIRVLIQNDFPDNEIKEIIWAYRDGDTWKEWEDLQRILEGIREDIKFREKRDKEKWEMKIAHEKKLERLKKESEFTSQLPFSVNAYDVAEHGIIKNVKLPNGYDDTVLLTPTPCYISAIGNNIDTGEITYKLHVKNIMGNEIDLWKKPGELLKRTEVLKLQDHIHFQEPVAKELMNYFDESILKFRNSCPIEITTSTNGWKNDNSLFVIGNKAISLDTVKPVTQLSEELRKNYSAKGDKEVWIKNLEKYLAYDLILMKMFATVGAFLIRFTPIDSFLVHHYYESSALKSLSMRIAASLIGNPNPDGIVQTADNTPTGIELYLETHSDTPIYWDETSDNPNFL
jgi:uncharacterized protein (DUF927 family)